MGIGNWLELGDEVDLLVCAMADLWGRIMGMPNWIG